jgi:hypothetical protein
MKPQGDLPLDAVTVDVRELLSATVASLYSHLVTRPTGRAVRLAIENQLRVLPRPVLSLVDLSSVSILDFSCADEVVAKLVLALRDEEHRGTFVLFRGVRAFHRDPIQTVLERHDLRAVIQDDVGETQILGSVSEGERALWARLEVAGRIPFTQVESGEFLGPQEAPVLEGLLQRRLIFRHPRAGDLYALSALSTLLQADPRPPR